MVVYFPSNSCKKVVRKFVQTTGPENNIDYQRPVILIRWVGRINHPKSLRNIRQLCIQIRTRKASNNYCRFLRMEEMNCLSSECAHCVLVNTPCAYPEIS